MTFTVMSFNVRGSFHDDGINDWENRSELSIGTIIRYAPDILGLQEAQQGNLDEYAVHLSHYDVEFGPISIRQTERFHRVPIYWNPARFEKVNSGGFYLSETPDEWSFGWDSTLVRATTWIKLREIATQNEFVVLNTHFPHEREAESTRTACADLIVRQLRTIATDTPQIVMADFNANPTSEAYQVFMNNGFVDSASQDAAVFNMDTFHGFKGADCEWQSGRIDWILTKNGQQSLESRSFQIITDAEPPLYPSDHYPVIAELDFA